MKKLKNVLHLYIGCGVIIDSGDRGTLLGGTFVPNSAGQIYYDIQTPEMVKAEGSDFHMPYNQDADGEPRIKPILRKLEDGITEDEWESAWAVIGGTPHLYTYGIGELKAVLMGESLEDLTLQMDYFTMAQLINYFRSIGIDCDDLINSGLAIDAITIKQP